MGSGWIVVAEGWLRRVLGEDPRLNSGDLGIVCHVQPVWPIYKVLDICLGCAILRQFVSIAERQEPRRLIGSATKTMHQSQGDGLHLFVGVDGTPEAGLSCFRGFLLPNSLKIKVSD